MSRPCLLLTNDDGIESDGLHTLIRGLHERGFPIVVVSPATEQSASGMRLSLRQDLKFEERQEAYPSQTDLRFACSLWMEHLAIV